MSEVSLGASDLLEINFTERERERERQMIFQAERYYFGLIPWELNLR